LTHHFQGSYLSIFPPVAWTLGSDTGWKDKKGIEENLSKWNLIIKEYRLKLNTDMTVTTQILSNQHIPITLHDTVVKWVDKFIYLGSEISSKGKISRKT
jgi:hypothetical protein